MERECFVVTDNSYFYLGLTEFFSGLPNHSMSKLSLNFFCKTNNYRGSDLFFVCFDDMLSNFKALLFFESMNNDVVFFSKNNKVSELCSRFGFNGNKIEKIMDVNVMFRKRDENGDRRKLLSKMEVKVITKLLDGESNVNFARKVKRSEKTISHHKRRALFKVGLDDINLFYNNINKDIFDIL
ncbi:LuxR C-terminal-related transcriptional regulator [Serratia fonticola]|uniref:LuxR C-terminal-related transcriptional regulator n=1 Tax=Serratia fonticola TaxID=47917 RepID=UPI00192D0B20|nr:LuxR C-terminal-related transcriptional regulator [Serratia fonticola]MBL5829176.1 hypothetical protein [Serratia fonticola]